MTRNIHTSLVINSTLTMHSCISNSPQWNSHNIPLTCNLWGQYLWVLITNQQLFNSLEYNSIYHYSSMMMYNNYCIIINILVTEYSSNHLCKKGSSVIKYQSMYQSPHQSIYDSNVLTICIQQYITSIRDTILVFYSHHHDSSVQPWKFKIIK